MDGSGLVLGVGGLLRCGSRLVWCVVSDCVSVYLGGLGVWVFWVLVWGFVACCFSLISD